MSQDRQNPARLDTDGLIIRIMGRIKEHKISRMIGETEEKLKVRVVEAVNAHPGSLNDEAVAIQPDYIEYIKARSGPFVTQVKKSHGHLSVKLCERAEDKLSHKKARKHSKGVNTEVQGATERSPQRTRRAQGPKHGEPDCTRAPSWSKPEMTANLSHSTSAEGLNGIQANLHGLFLN